MTDATFLIALAVCVVLFHVPLAAAPFVVGGIYLVGKLVLSGPD